MQDHHQEGMKEWSSPCLARLVLASLAACFNLLLLPVDGVEFSLTSRAGLVWKGFSPDTEACKGEFPATVPGSGKYRSTSATGPKVVNLLPPILVDQCLPGVRPQCIWICSQAVC